MMLFEKRVFFANPISQFNSHRAEILAAIEEVCTNGPHSLGPAVEKFEKEFSAWHGLDFGIGVGSGTDALFLTLKAFGIGQGDEVITVSHTALPTASAIIMSGATPVLVDVEEKSCTLDPSKLEEAITDKTKAIIPVHLYGFPCRIDEIIATAKKHKLIVIEDCAQAHGAKYNGKRVGTFGDAACFSFYPTKNLGAIGDAGAVITNSKEIADKLKKIRQYGWDEKKCAYMTGWLSRMDPIQAVILSIKLKALDQDNEKRRINAKVYDEYIDWEKYQRPVAVNGSEPVYHLYVIKTEKRNEVIENLGAENVIAGIHYEYPVHLNPGYAPLVRIPERGLRITEKLAASVLSLPIYPELPAEYIRKISEFINDL